MTRAHRQWEQGDVGWQGTGAGGRGRGVRFTTGSVRTSLLGAAEPPPWRRRHLRLQGTGLRWAMTRLPQGRTRGGGTGGEARGVLMWTHACFWTGWTSALKGGSVERAYPEEAGRPRGPSCPCLWPGSEPGRLGTAQTGRGNSRPEQARLLQEPEDTVAAGPLLATVETSDWERVSPRRRVRPLNEGTWDAGGFRVQICTYTWAVTGVLTLSLFSLELILSSLWTEAAIPTGLVLTDFENAIQVTARSKNPIPMTCSVFSVTESQMRTFGGNCCLENNAESPTVPRLHVYLYLEIMRIL